MSYNQIDEEIRQYKLFTIQETTNKLKKFNQAYNEIKQHGMVKYTKNVGSNIVRILVGVVTFVLLILTFLSFNPNMVIAIIESSGENLVPAQKISIQQELDVEKYVYLTLTIMSYLLGLVIKKNNQKRSSIYKLSKLLEEVTSYMDDTLQEDKKRYENFVEAIAEREKYKQNNT